MESRQFLLYLLIGAFMLFGSCNRVKQQNKITILKNEIQILKDSLKDLNNHLYKGVRPYKFRAIKLIDFPSDTTLILGRSYKINCLIAADGMIKKNHIAHLKILANSKKNNTYHIKKENGINKLIITPTHLGLDTINLTYVFNFKDSTILSLKMPKRLIFRVKKSTPPSVPSIEKKN